MVKKIFAILLLMLFSSNSSKAFDLDMTVDDDIRKNYNPSKLVKEYDVEQNTDKLDPETPGTNLLPELPEIVKSEMQMSNVTNSDNKNNINKSVEPRLEYITTDSIVNERGKRKLHAGITVDVVNSSKLSDWLSVGTMVKFYTKAPIVKRRYIIPVNTLFYGEVIESHRPQISCNGGLLVIRIRKMVFNGRTYPLNAYITRADDKMIFLNNIKGDRTYLKTTWKKGNWGRTLFNKMFTITLNLGGDGSTLLFSPFPFAYGTICLGVNAITSPICAFFSKGGHVSIPAGSSFRIKLLDDAYYD